MKKSTKQNIISGICLGLIFVAASRISEQSIFEMLSGQEKIAFSFRNIAAGILILFAVVISIIMRIKKIGKSA